MADEQFKNSLCRDTGKHDFRSTTSTFFRKCQRAHCQAAQRLVNGSWVDVVTRSPRAMQQESTVHPLALPGLS